MLTIFQFGTNSAPNSSSEDDKTAAHHPLRYPTLLSTIRSLSRPSLCLPFRSSSQGIASLPNPYAHPARYGNTHTNSIITCPHCLILGSYTRRNAGLWIPVRSLRTLCNCKRRISLDYNSDRRDVIAKHAPFARYVFKDAGVQRVDLRPQRRCKNELTDGARKSVDTVVPELDTAAEHVASRE